MKKILFFVCTALALGFQACNDNDDLWNAIDDLKSRVQALETQVSALNGNVEALQKLYGGATISKVGQDADGTYTITLTNGETIVLRQGSDAEAVIPLIGIDDDGFWQYSVDGGTTWKNLGVKAIATDGRTPQFRIDEQTGYWQVRYADTEQWKNITDTQGEPVKAIGDGAVTDKFFSAVEVRGDTFYIKMLDGTELLIPIVKDFYCRIVVDKQGVQQFDAGATKRFAVEQKGVASAVVTAPEGWKARLTEGSELVVTAPPATRATADTERDVAIQAVSASGFTAIAKIEVVSSGAAPTAPTVAVAASTTVAATQSTLTFDLTLSSDTDSWKYLCQKTAEKTDPDAAAIDATGTAGSGTTLTLEGLDAGTAYTLYVVAIKNTDPVLYSSVASAEATTASVPDSRTDYYTKYQNGETITVGSLSINKATYGDAQLVKVAEMTDELFTREGIAFIDDSEDVAGAGYTVQSDQNLVLARIILIGRYAESQPVIRASAANKPWYCKVNQVAGGFPSPAIVFKNIRLVGNTQYMFATSSATSDPSIYLEDCTIELKNNLFYDNNANFCFVNLYVGNSIVECKTASKPLYAISTSGNTTTKTVATQRSFVFANNVIYSSGASALRNTLVNLGNQTIAYATDELEIELTHNTLYNIYQINDMLVKAYSAKKIVAQYNVGFISETADTSDKQTYLIGAYHDSGSGGPFDASHNYLFETATHNKWNPTYGTGVTYTKGDNVINDAAAHPFSSVDVAKGYFPVDPAVVTNGAGALYDTKRWLKIQ